MTQAKQIIRAVAIAAAALAFTSFAHAAPDVDAAKALAKQNNCFKCHAVDKDKDGPSYHSVAEKYKGKPGAEAKLINQSMLTSSIKKLYKELKRNDDNLKRQVRIEAKEGS